MKRIKEVHFVYETFKCNGNIQVILLFNFTSELFSCFAVAVIAFQFSALFQFLIFFFFTKMEFSSFQCHHHLLTIMVLIIIIIMVPIVIIIMVLIIIIIFLAHFPNCRAHTNFWAGTIITKDTHPTSDLAFHNCTSYFPLIWKTTLGFSSSCMGIIWQRFIV